MAIVNGTLKYKQDDGSIVELGPVGVDARARTLATAAGQTANSMKASIDALNTKVERLENLPTLDLPIIGICTGTGPNNIITIAVPIPSVVRLLTVKGHIPTFSISGGTIGVVFEYKDPDYTIHSFALSSVSVSNLGVFVSITGKSSLTLPIDPGNFVWGSYKQAATVTTLHVTFS